MCASSILSAASPGDDVKEIFLGFGFIYMNISICLYLYISLYISIYIVLCVCMCVHLCVCVCTSCLPPSHSTLFASFLSYQIYLFMYWWSRLCAPRHGWQSEDNLCEWFFPSTVWTPGIEVRSPDKPSACHLIFWESISHWTWSPDWYRIFTWC